MFQLYRFSPIQDIQALHDAIVYIHSSCHTLCKNTLGRYAQVVGTIGVFAHYEDEYRALLLLQEHLCLRSQHKYKQLCIPLMIPAGGGTPAATYTHLYIRKPDIYRAQVGDIDFCVDDEIYATLKQDVVQDTGVYGARVFPRTDFDMVELYHPDVDALGYMYTADTKEKIFAQ